MYKINVLLPVSVLLINNVAFAEETSKSTWEASAELGYVATSGNTENESLNAKAMVSNDRKNWKHQLIATALSSSDEIGTTAEKYTLHAQSNYKLSGADYLYGLVKYEKDRFGGYEYQVTESIGYGRRVVDHENLSLDLEIGPGARQSKLDNGDTEDETILRGAAKLDWKISKSSTFGEILSVESGEDITITKSVTSLSSQIDGNLSMKVTYTIKHTSEVPEDVDDTDTETAVTLVYNF